MCDLAHVTLAEETERRVIAERQVAAVLIAAGAEGVDLPSVTAALDELNAELESVPRETPASLRLLNELGVA